MDVEGRVTGGEGRLARQYGKLNLQVREIQRQSRLAQASPPSRRSSNDEMDSEWERHTLRLAENQAIRRAQTLVEFEGRLVSIGEPDCAKSPLRSIEVIDLTHWGQGGIYLAGPWWVFFKRIYKFAHLLSTRYMVGTF